MKRLLVILSVLPLYSNASTVSKPDVIRFGVNTPGSAPYLYYDENTQSYSGVVVDFFDFVATTNAITVSYLDSNRARSEQLLQSGVIDVFLSSPKWLENPDAVLKTTALIQHDSYMYSPNAFLGPFIPSEAKASSICTRYGFVYPVLQPFFDKREHGLIRVNSSSQETMAIMLAKGRCDFAIMSEQNALSVMFQEKMCAATFHQSPNVISSVPLVFIIRSELTQLQVQINEALVKFINSGARDNAMKRHSGGKYFPKKKC